MKSITVKNEVTNEANVAYVAPTVLPDTGVLRIDSVAASRVNLAPTLFSTIS
jgi:hypothetical protein